MSKIALPIAELKPALIGLGKIIAKRVTVPVLNHLKIERTKDGWIALTSTDLDHFITAHLEQPSEGEPLSLLVPYDELLKFTKNSPKTDTLFLNCDSKTVTIQYAIGSQVAEAKVDSLPVEEFPEIPRIKGDPIPVNDAVRQSIHDALECASTDETRFDPQQRFYRYAQTRCSLRRRDRWSSCVQQQLVQPSIEGFADHSGQQVRRLEGIQQRRRVATKVAPTEKKDEPGHVQISSRRWRYITRQIEGNYPNWRQVVPTSFNTSVEFGPESGEQIIQTIQRMPVYEVINHTLGIEMKAKKVSFLCKASADQSGYRSKSKTPPIKAPMSPRISIVTC